MGLFDNWFSKGKGGGVSGPKRLDLSSRYELDRHSFSGTMSKFRVARDIKTGEFFGIKLLDSEKRAYFEQRFKGLNKPEEGVIASQMDHPCIVKTYEYGTTTKGEHYILMEYIRGPGLNTLINDRNPGLIPYRLELLTQMVQSIDAVHDKGFIHRDICPRNFISYDDFKKLKLIDFGLSVPDLPEFRTPGNRTGTPQYMAPEVVRRRSTDKRLDLFSMGVTMYKLLCFEHPWDATDTSGLAALNHDQRPATDIMTHRPDLHPALARIVMKCLEANPDNRPRDAKAVLRALADLKSDKA
ncbi:MAG: serine/threonine protein kinase [Planctomycetaceae bacterium]|nr:serine/threonine protein kinase [Planctomycetaceae bacterium]